MPVRLDKTWIPLTPEHIAPLPDTSVLSARRCSGRDCVYWRGGWALAVWSQGRAHRSAGRTAGWGDAVSLRSDHGVSHALS